MPASTTTAGEFAAPIHLPSERCSLTELGLPARLVSGRGQPQHCSDCRRRWVNNCIGANNLRWFLAFLLSNFLLAVYGADPSQLERS